MKEQTKIKIRILFNKILRKITKQILFKIYPD